MKRQTNIMVEVEAILRLWDGSEERVVVSGIPCVWKWDEGSRDAAEYWAAAEHLSSIYKADWYSIVAWSGSPVREDA